MATDAPTDHVDDPEQRFYERVGFELEQRRRKLRHARRQAAERLGVTEQTIHAWERGRSRPSMWTVKLYAELYGSTLETVIRRAETPDE